jgi:histone-lysine N-methyltransferase SETMAR
MEWQHSGSTPTNTKKKFQVQKSTEKVLASLVWDQDSIQLTDYLPKGRTIKADYYSSLLVQLKDILKEKCRGKFTKGVLFFFDNNPDHRVLVTQKKLAYLGFQCLDHPLYSPDLALSDYQLFPGLKKQLKSSQCSFDT